MGEIGGKAGVMSQETVGTRARNCYKHLPYLSSLTKKFSSVRKGTLSARFEK
jgi:hypothetical protein